ncbi:hypothetical protein C0J52_24022, partial [Blattella germanica]
VLNAKKRVQTTLSNLWCILNWRKKLFKTDVEFPFINKDGVPSTVDRFNFISPLQLKMQVPRIDDNGEQTYAQRFRGVRTAVDAECCIRRACNKTNLSRKLFLTYITQSFKNKNKLVKYFKQRNIGTFCINISDTGNS